MVVLLYATYLTMSKDGRLANTMSFLVKHSSTADGDEMITAKREPSWREKMWPDSWEKVSKVRWSGCLRRWR